MTPTILVSVPLLALVVSSLPILPDSDSELILLAGLEKSAQTFFCLRSSRPADDLHREAKMYTVSASAAADNGCLSYDPKTFSPVGESTNLEGPGPFGQQITTMVSSGDAASIAHYLPELVTENGETGVFFTSAFTTLMVIFSCAIALLALACVGLELFVIKYIRTKVLGSHQAWHLLPRIEKHTVSSYRKAHPDSEMVVPQIVLDEKREQIPCFNACIPTMLSCISPPSGDLELDTEDENFYDALDTAPSFSVQDLPPSDSPSPDLPLLLIRLSPGPTPDQRFRPPQTYIPPLLDPAICELPACPSSLWIAVQNPTPISSPLIRPRSRAYHSVPELDIARAMQLLGADAAWMVRFFMTIFGWFAVAFTGRR